MKISLKWLNDYVTIPEGIAPEKLAYDLTMTTVEVEQVENVAERFAGMVLGRIEEINPHPRADRLRLVKVSVGPSRVVGIVCGGTNLRTEMFVAVALPGAKVRVHGEGEPQVLQEVKLRGEPSHGMICSSDELDLAAIYPAAYAEVMDLSEEARALALAPGAALADALEFNDVVLHIDNKSLTNRPDLWGHYGVARELAAIYDLELKNLPELQLPPDNRNLLSVNISEPQLCYRYIGVVIDGISAAPSPCWMQRRLLLMGQRPINLLVDLTNYVMFAVGQPMHVFDYGKVAGRKINVRSAVDGERLLLLDGSESEFVGGDLLIADDEKPLALAGVMGGEPSSVTETTTSIILESAGFEPIAIRRTAARLGIRTESSMRFEKGIDSPRARQGTDLFCSLLSELQPGINLSASSDCYPTKPVEHYVSVSHQFIVSRIGQEISQQLISSRLARLGFRTSWEGDLLSLDVPSWRATGDVSIAEDIVEEVARLHGYDNLCFIPPKIELHAAVLQRDQIFFRDMRGYLSSAAAMNEVMTYPWVEDRYLDAAGITPEECITLHAPPSRTAKSLKPSLVPNLLEGVAKNRRHFDAFRIFEITRVFRKDGTYPGACPGETLPAQPKHLAGAVAAAKPDEAFFTAKGIVAGLFAHLGYPSCEWAAVTDGPSWAVKSALLAIKVEQKLLGHLGLLSPAAAAKADIERTAVAVFEIDATALAACTAEGRIYQAIPQHPVLQYDLAVLFDVGVAWSDIAAVATGTDPLIRDLLFVDEYRGDQIPAGKKSVAFRMLLSDPLATLTIERATGVADRVLASLSTEFGAELRKV